MKKILMPVFIVILSSVPAFASPVTFEYIGGQVTVGGYALDNHFIPVKLQDITVSDDPLGGSFILTDGESKTFNMGLQDPVSFYSQYDTFYPIQQEGYFVYLLQGAYTLLIDWSRKWYDPIHGGSVPDLSSSVELYINGIDLGPDDAFPDTSYYGPSIPGRQFVLGDGSKIEIAWTELIDYPFGSFSPLDCSDIRITNIGQIPEPATIVLFGAGLFTMLMGRGKRKSA